jgi:hypothetical protein
MVVADESIAACAHIKDDNKQNEDDACGGMMGEKRT